MSSDIVHHKNCFDIETKRSFYDNLMKDIPWKKVQWRPGTFLPRKVFRYNFDSNIEALNLLKLSIEEAFNRKIVSAWCNLYESGKDWTPFHQDSYGMDVATVSFGSTRRCVFQKIADGSKEEYLLEDGDILFFTPVYDSQHKHSIPKTKIDVGPRISVVFFFENI